MTEGIIIAIITAGLSLVGVVITVMYGQKQTKKTIQAQTDLTIYRIDELEKKQDKHNTLIERMYIVEGKLDKLDEKLKVENHRITDLEAFHKPHN
jgi:predicted nuclease with TOPRIM domain